jgi:hypothetical protein
MSPNFKQLRFEFGRKAEGEGARSESREPAMDRVEYTAYPRVSHRQREMVAVTIDRSPSGLRIRSTTQEEVGSLLHVVVRNVDDQPTRDALARVAWCAEVGEGHFHIGLAVVEEVRRQMRKVRPYALARRKPRQLTGTDS